MLIGEVFEETPRVTAAENMATRLADKIRNLWLVHHKRGEWHWEDNFYEDPDGVSFLRAESFPNLQGIDYIFRWWGNKDDEGLAGDLEVLWKILRGGEMRVYKTTIRFANRDFPAESTSSEDSIRKAMRSDFRQAFAIWEKLYAEQLNH